MNSRARTRCRVLITAAALVAAMAIPPLAGVAAATPARPAGAGHGARAPERTGAASAVPHYQHNTKVNHYSLLSTIQHAPGLGSLNFTCDTAHVGTYDGTGGMRTLALHYAGS